MSIGTNIRRLRTKSKRSQQDIADLLGIERNTYANWEKGTNDIKSEYIPKLSEIFEVEIQDLFNAKDIVSIVNNSTNNDNATGGLHGFIINISDKESTAKLVDLMEKILKNLEK
jgi:transcriptional regulator with XRE-family HTH domain